MQLQNAKIHEKQHLTNLSQVNGAEVQMRMPMLEKKEHGKSKIHLGLRKREGDSNSGHSNI